MNAVRALTALVLAAVLLGAGCADDPGPTAPADYPPPGWLTGRVQDDTGRPLAEIRVAATAGAPSAVTRSDGRFWLGPFAAGDTVGLVTESPDTVSAPGADDAWYDVTTAPVAVASAAPLTLTLLTRYAIELEGLPEGWPSNDHFSHFLEYTTAAVGNGINVCWSWPAFPLTVAVPDTLIVHTTAGGEVAIDAGACVRAGLRRWNDAAGFPLLVETDDAAAAQVVVAYPVLGSLKPAETAATDPGGRGFRTRAPTRVEVRLSSVHIPDEPRFTSIAAHEFGHALGFWGHIQTNRRLVENGVPVATLMGTSGGTDDAPIHPLELRAILAKLHIPGGTACEQYEGTFPWFADFPPLPGPGGEETAP